MTGLEFSPDCARCAALCCVAPAFDRSEEFAFDKPACVACPNLALGDRCRIHARLEAEGFGGCVLYDCLGAGQRVVQELYAGRSWREEPELLDEMWRALSRLRGVHELVLLLGEAAKAPLSIQEREELNSLQKELEPEKGWTPDSLQVFAQGTTSVRVMTFLRSLKRHLTR